MFVSACNFFIFICIHTHFLDLFASPSKFSLTFYNVKYKRKDEMHNHHEDEELEP